MQPRSSEANNIPHVLAVVFVDRHVPHIIAMADIGFYQAARYRVPELYAPVLQLLGACGSQKPWGEDVPNLSPAALASPRVSPSHLATGETIGAPGIESYTQDRPLVSLERV